MRIDHFALNVKEPHLMAQWYVTNLNMSFVRRSDEPPYVHMLASADGGSMIELYANPAGEFLDYSRMHALTFHIAIATDDLVSDRDRLVVAGATVDSDIMINPSGYQMVIIRDPWGNALQLVQAPEE